MPAARRPAVDARPAVVALAPCGWCLTGAHAGCYIEGWGYRCSCAEHKHDLKAALA